MKRDLDLIRKVLLHIEKHNDARGMKDQNEQSIAHALYSLKSAGFIEGIGIHTADPRTGDLEWTGRPRITWKGQEFLDSARDQWNWLTGVGRIYSYYMDIDDVSVEVLAELLNEVARERLEVGEFGKYANVQSGESVC